jgi:PAS domain S-box-containing protein
MNSIEMMEYMVQFDHIERQAEFDHMAEKWLALLEAGFPPYHFALVRPFPDKGMAQLFKANAPPVPIATGTPAMFQEAVEHVLKTGESTDIKMSRAGTAHDDTLPGVPRAIRFATLLPLNRQEPEGILIVGSLRPEDMEEDQRRQLSLLAFKLGYAFRRASKLDYLSATCNDLERKCSLRMTALKKTVKKLEMEIRERKKFEAALVEKEDQFRAIADYTYGWESWIGEDGRLLWVNPLVAHLTGYPQQDCFAMEDYPLDIIVEEDRPRIGGLLKKALYQHTSGNDVEFRIRHRDGSHRWMALSWQPIYNDLQAFMGFRTSIRDISQRKEAEEKLRRSHSKLEEEVERRTARVRALQERLQAENLFLKKELADTAVYGEIIGDSPSIKTVISRIELVAPTQASVLILGESGTGKELVAREIHGHSHLKDRPFLPVNCATIPKDLYESEFFGHVKGAFTGAVRDRVGRFEAADGGTIFLDEVGEIPLPLQGKLLRVLQEGEFERVGEGKTRRVKVRIIAATNTDLQTEVGKKRFREDLYYRLNVFPIEITPLRFRKDDLSLLASHFLERYAKRMNRPTPKLTKANLMDLQAYDWPGNVRELQNLIERALILSPGGRLRFDLPSADQSVSPEWEPHPAPAAGKHGKVMTEDEVKELLKHNIIAALKQSGGKIYGTDGAAELLGVKPTTLTERIKAMGIQRPV